MGAAPAAPEAFAGEGEFVRKLLTTIFACILILAACGNDAAPVPDDEYLHELVGTWAWDIGNAFLYVFNADGAGRRGTETSVETFEWRTEGDLLMIDLVDSPYVDETLLNQRWTFVISNNSLTITSRQVADMEFTYIRVP